MIVGELTAGKFSVDELTVDELTIQLTFGELTVVEFTEGKLIWYLVWQLARPLNLRPQRVVAPSLRRRRS